MGQFISGVNPRRYLGYHRQRLAKLFGLGRVQSHGLLNRAGLDGARGLGGAILAPRARLMYWRDFAFVNGVVYVQFKLVKSVNAGFPYVGHVAVAVGLHDH